MLQTKMKMKSVNTRGKYFMPASPVLSRSMPATNSWATSATDCSRLGTSERAAHGDHEEADGQHHGQQHERPRSW